MLIVESYYTSTRSHANADVPRKNQLLLTLSLAMSIELTSSEYDATFTII